MPKSETLNSSEANHELLISIGKDVLANGDALKAFTARAEAEFSKIWRHIEQSQEKATAAVTLISEKVNAFGRPNVTNIVAVVTLIGAIAMAFISPIKSDMGRFEKDRETLAGAVVTRTEAIAKLGTDVASVSLHVDMNSAKIREIEENGTPAARERLARLETDQEWITGKKKLPKD